MIMAVIPTHLREYSTNYNVLMEEMLNLKNSTLTCNTLITATCMSSKSFI